MADTRRSLTALQALLADNNTGAISPQDVRDLLVSAAPPYGSIYLSSSSETSIGGIGTWTKAAGTTTSTNLKEFTMPASNRLTYTGTPDVHVHVAVSVSMTSASNNQTVGLRIGKNGSAAGTDAVASEVRRFVSTGADIGSTAIHFDTMMSTNDYLELFVANHTSTGNLTIGYMYFFALGMLV